MKKRPATLDPPAPTIPCPRCKAPLVERPDYLADYAEKHRMPHIAEIGVYMCKSCRIAAAHVDGVKDEWRGEGKGLIDTLATDADDGLRLKRFLDDDDPMWRRVW